MSVNGRVMIKAPYGQLVSPISRAFIAEQSSIHVDVYSSRSYQDYFHTLSSCCGSEGGPISLQGCGPQVNLCFITTDQNTQAVNGPIG